MSTTPNFNIIFMDMTQVLLKQVIIGHIMNVRLVRIGNITHTHYSRKLFVTSSHWKHISDSFIVDQKQIM